MGQTTGDLRGDDSRLYCPRAAQVQSTLYRWYDAMPCHEVDACTPTPGRQRHPSGTLHSLSQQQQVPLVPQKDKEEPAMECASLFFGPAGPQFW